MTTWEAESTQRSASESWQAHGMRGGVRPLRNERTYVLMRFDEAPGGGTRVRLTYFGRREGAGWNAIYDYFDKAWTSVMESFRKAYDAPAATTK